MATALATVHSVHDTSDASDYLSGTLGTRLQPQLGPRAGTEFGVFIHYF